MTLIARAVCYIEVRGHFFTGGPAYRHLLNATPTGIRAPNALNITPDTEAEIGCLKTPPQCKMDGMCCYRKRFRNLSWTRTHHLDEGHGGPQDLSKH